MCHISLVLGGMSSLQWAGIPRGSGFTQAFPPHFPSKSCMSLQFYFHGMIRVKEIIIKIIILCFWIQMGAHTFLPERAHGADLHPHILLFCPGVAEVVRVSRAGSIGWSILSDRASSMIREEQLETSKETTNISDYYLTDVSKRQSYWEVALPEETFKIKHMS